MAEYKLFDTPKFHDEAFYKEREVADHINQPYHRQRLLTTLLTADVLLGTNEELVSVCDFGCGNGGLLNLLREHNPTASLWGYDLCPANITYAQDVYKVRAWVKDFTTAWDVAYPNVAILTECLEHLTDPHGFLARLGRGCQYVIASSPVNETPENHYEFHLWAWDKAGFEAMFADAGFDVVSHFIDGDTQHVVAKAA